MVLGIVVQIVVFEMCAWRDSNARPTAPEAVALSI